MHVISPKPVQLPVPPKLPKPREDQRPITIQQILENDIRLQNQEYLDLKELDSRKHELQFSKNIGRSYSLTKPDGTKRSLNR